MHRKHIYVRVGITHTDAQTQGLCTFKVNMGKYDTVGSSFRRGSTYILILPRLKKSQIDLKFTAEKEKQCFPVSQCEVKMTSL